MTSRPSSRPQGFTLMELLIVMTIIASLVGITAAAATMMQKKARRLKAETQITSITLGLEKYKQEYSEYPAVKGKRKTDFDGVNYEVAGAVMLYQALTGDGTSAIDGLPGRPSNGKLTDEQDGIMFLEAADPANKAAGLSQRLGDSSIYYLADPFAKPYQYKSAGDTENIADLHNPETYDLWSFGYDDTGTASEPERWITNW